MMDWDTLTPLTALTHLDGRNSRKVTPLKSIFSEYAWMKSRLGVMSKYLAYISFALTKRALPLSEEKKLQAIEDSFSLSDAKTVREIERTTNHDLKALEVYFESSLKKQGLCRLIPYINIGIGSEDINNISLGITFHSGRGEVLVPAIGRVARALAELAKVEEKTSMIGRTHAQPANVTTFGKECANPLSRLCDEIEYFTSLPLSAKCGGEVGSFQAFMGVDASVDWIRFTDTFVRGFGLKPTHTATQIAPYDSMVRFLQSLYRINSIFLDLCKNMWLYVLLGYLNVKKIDAEVGSAGMPHKVNPIFFEGAEGGLETANGIIELLVRKLPINRLQRDFSDSTMRRNLVLPFAFSLLSYQSLEEAFKRVTVDREMIAKDLKSHAEVWTETIKVYGTMHGVEHMYDRLKEATRGRVVSFADLLNIVNSLPLKEKEKQELMILCDGHHNPYPGRIVDEVVRRARKVFHF
ncbi:MAG: lyase family protein [Patescibacteria group bacterium]